MSRRRANVKSKNMVWLEINLSGFRPNNCTTYWRAFGRGCTRFWLITIGASYSTAVSNTLCTYMWNISEHIYMYACVVHWIGDSSLETRRSSERSERSNCNSQSNNKIFRNIVYYTSKIILFNFLILSHSFIILFYNNFQCLENRLG